MRTLNEHYGSWHNSKFQYFLNEPHFDIEVIIHYYWAVTCCALWGFSRFMKKAPFKIWYNVTDFIEKIPLKLKR